jgi:hypothetical protein
MRVSVNLLSMRTKLLFAGLAAGSMAALSSPAIAQMPPGSRDCSFQSLSPEEKSRYQSRYRRRVRVDGQAFADKWLYEQVCMTASERKALRRPRKGKNCRAVSRPVTSLDGSMTVGIGRKCD